MGLCEELMKTMQRRTETAPVSLTPPVSAAQAVVLPISQPSKPAAAPSTEIMAKLRALAETKGYAPPPVDDLSASATRLPTVVSVSEEPRESPPPEPRVIRTDTGRKKTITICEGCGRELNRPGRHKCKGRIDEQPPKAPAQAPAKPIPEPIPAAPPANRGKVNAFIVDGDRVKVFFSDAGPFETVTRAEAGRRWPSEWRAWIAATSRPSQPEPKPESEARPKREQTAAELVANLEPPTPPPDPKPKTQPAAREPEPKEAALPSAPTGPSTSPGHDRLMFLVMFDVLFERLPPDGLDILHLPDLLAPLCDAVARENQIEYWASVDYGKGPSQLAAKLDRYLVANASKLGRAVIICDSDSPETRAVKDVLKRRARAVLRGRA